MDKETLSHYGWIVILVLILAVLLALASPFGNFVAGAIKATTAGFFGVNQAALNSTGLITVDDQEFNDASNGAGIDTSNEFVPGLYQTGAIEKHKAGENITTMLKMSWDELLEKGILHNNGGVVSGNYDTNLYENSSSSDLLGDLIMPTDGTVTSIANHTFRSCTMLTGVTIPDSVTSIGERAFQKCDGLTSMEIPNSVTSMGKSVFWMCSNLKSAVIGNSVTSIEDYTFAFCESLTSVVIGDSVTNIKSDAFRGCTGLNSMGPVGSDASVELSSSVKTIGNSAFSSTGLQNVVIPNTVGRLENSAFSTCGDLVSVVIGDGVSYIGNSAFAECTKLANLSYAGNISRWNSVTKGSAWKINILATEVICSDGTVSLS